MTEEVKINAASFEFLNESFITGLPKAYPKIKPNRDRRNKSREGIPHQFKSNMF